MWRYLILSHTELMGATDVKATFPNSTAGATEGLNRLSVDGWEFMQATTMPGMNDRSATTFAVSTIPRSSNGQT